MSDIPALEQQLDDFDPAIRRAALEALAAKAASGEVACKPPRDWVNLHCHSSFSYNGYGMSPSAVVWMAKKEGLAMVGLVDFDVLDGVDEFHAAGRLLGIRTTAAIETRAFIPPFASREINSPGEPGVAYHMGCGFAKSAIDDPKAQAIAAKLRASAKERNLSLLAAVNGFLAPVELDYDADVVPLTPAGNATERHVCEAYQRKAEELFPAAADRIAFWNEKLGSDTSAIIDDDAKLQGLIRSTTMKSGGVGYQQPDETTFPPTDEINALTVACKGIPMQAWLFGTSEGEQSMDELMDFHASKGVCALAIVPDRNWNIADPETKATRIAMLEKWVAAADARGWPVCVGTELNAPGLKFVDDFDAPELANVIASFKRGADILFGHGVAIAQGEPGYLDAEFDSVQAKNDHFAKLGRSTAVLPE